MTSPLPRSIRVVLVGAALMVGALGASGTGHALLICPDCISVPLLDPCLGC